MSLRITTVTNPSAEHDVPMLTCSNLPDTSAGSMYVIRHTVQADDLEPARVMRTIFSGDEIESALAGYSLDVHLGSKVELFELDFATIADVSMIQHRIKQCSAILAEDMYDYLTENERDEYIAARERVLANAGY